MVKKSAAIGKPKPLTNKEIQLALIDNFVHMQKVLTNLTIKFDNLSENMSRLLGLFEISAKTFIEKQEPSPIEEKDTLKKLDVLLEQNKTIANGLTLIEEKIRHKIYPESNRVISEELTGKPRPRPLPRI